MSTLDIKRPKRGNPTRQLSPLSAALLNHVATHPGSTFEQLCALYCPEADSGKGALVERLRARVAYLVSVGHLVRVVQSGVRGYEVGGGQSIAAQPKPAPRYASPVLAGRTPPRQNDVMHGAPYVPGPTPVLRPGALAYKACASVGYRC